MKYVALAVLSALVLAAALFLRTDRQLGVKRISYSFYKDELYDDFYRQSGADFQARWNREHPDDPIEVRYDPIGGDYGLKINAEIVAGTVQDIFFTWDFNTYVRRNTLLDLTPYVEKYHAQAQLGRIYPELIRAHTLNGHLYGLPNNLNTDVLYYNRTLFDREKMPYPTADWDWNDMLAAARRLTKRDAEDRLVQSGLTPCDFWKWIIWNRGRFWSPEGTRCIVNSPESLEALRFLHDLQYRYRVCPTLSEMRDTAGNISFENNYTAMMVGGRWWTVHMKNLSHVNWAVAPMPRSFRGRRLCDMGCNSIAVSAQTKYPDIVFQLLLFMTTPEQIKYLVDVGDSIPIHRGPEENAYFLNDPTRPKGENAAYFVGMDDVVVDLDTNLYSPLFPRGALDSALLQFNTAFVEADADVPKLLKDLQDGLNAACAEQTAPPAKPSIPAFALALGVSAGALGGAIAWQVSSSRQAA
jgi:ABC-type glycerol-3-phosphate transport system substrate-binding protein